MRKQAFQGFGNPKIAVCVWTALMPLFSWASCPDISGSFAGTCDAVCGSAHPQVTYEIEQKGCSQVSVSMGGAGGPVWKEEFDFANTVKMDALTAQVSLDATYTNEEIVTTFVATPKPGKADRTLITVDRYSSVTINGVKHLNVTSESFGHGITCSMTCRLPASTNTEHRLQ